jgi:hypothetical protein
MFGKEVRSFTQKMSFCLKKSGRIGPGGKAQIFIDYSVKDRLLFIFVSRKQHKN